MKILKVKCPKIALEFVFYALRAGQCGQDLCKSIIKNYSALQRLWEEAADISHDTETIARIRGVAAQMNKFEFFFGLILSEVLLSHTDNLSKSLQSKNCLAAGGQLIADMTKRTYQQY